MIKKIILKSATIFGLGEIPFMPGTWGTLVSIPFCYLLLQINTFVYMTITLLLTLFGIFAAELYEQQSSEHDSKKIIIDEFVGYLVTMVMLPATWQSLGLGFLLFRFFDILKPFPINYIDRKIPRGIGVMADDLAAGIIANLILQYLFLKTDILGSRLYAL